jgi:pimeloyl-ACP methyl ester carboxylesterase
MHPLRFTAHTSSNGVTERDFTLGEISGVLWSPDDGSAPSSLVLMSHGGGQHKRFPPQVARASHLVTMSRCAVVAIDAPGHGDRERTAEDVSARDDLRRADEAGESIAPIVERYATSVARRAVPEWRRVIDALQELPEIGDETPVGYGGGITLGTGIGIALAAAEPRIRAAIFGGGFIVNELLLETARTITVPVLFLLQWHEELVDRQSALALFDAFGSTEKTMHANPGGHREVPAFELDDSARFLARHLTPDRP